MKKITKDCYVDVSGWTEEEVQKVAEMFAEELGCGILDIDTHLQGYTYLHYMDCKDGVGIFTGTRYDAVEFSKCTTQLTKEDIFGSSNEEASEWDGKGLPPVGEVIMIRGTSSGSMCKGIVRYIDERRCVWSWAEEPNRTMHNYIKEMSFEPVKSEKDKEIEKIAGILNYHPITYSGVNEELAEYLYNQGLRFTGKEI